MFCKSVILCCFFCVGAVYGVAAQPVETGSEQAYGPAWLALVHYRSTWSGGYKSSIDSPDFFIAPDGKTNPEAELQATIDLMNNPNADIQKKCLFPARYMYLQKHQKVHENFPNCSEYEQFRADLNPAGITLLYTDAYMSNPSSLFGHTLMRIDIPEGKTQLVAHGMNYGAYVDENTAGALYALYGLTGGYYGGFTVKPYYDIINTYNNMENRDIWEYMLQLTPAELDFFVAHLWEMGHTQTRYYFFSKNCSYLLMEVLDAVRPNLKLADDFPAHAIPLDTVKAVHQREGLVKDIVYRPSRQKRIAHRYAALLPVEKKALLSYLESEKTDKVDALPENGQIAVWDTAYEFLQYQWVKQNIELSDYRRKSFQVLRKRRNIVATSPEVKINADNPVLAHDSMRVSATVGTQRGRVFEELGWRGAYHSLVEKQTGLLSGAEIHFLDTTIRYLPQTHHLHLQQLDLIKITSLAPFNALFHPMSYQIQTGIMRQRNAQTNREKPVYLLKGGSGITYQPITGFSAYSLVHTQVQYGGGFYRHPFGVALGISGGLIYYYRDMQAQVEGARDFSDNKMMAKTRLTGEINYAVSQNWAIGTQCRFERYQHYSDNTLKFIVKKYY